MTKEEIDTMMNNIEKKYKTYTCSISRGNGKSLKTTLDFLHDWELLKLLNKRNKK